MEQVDFSIMGKLYEIVNKSYENEFMLTEACTLLSIGLGASVVVLDSFKNVLFKKEKELLAKNLESLECIPLFFGSDLLAEVNVYRDIPYTDDEVAVIKAFSSVINLLVRRLKEEKETEGIKNISVVKSAVGALSYSELLAVVEVISSLSGSGGIVVAASLSKKRGVARSAIVNALRKLEGAGLLEARSLGVKGTYIKVLNEQLLVEIGKLKT